MNELPSQHYLNSPRGIKSWLFTLDHKRIGVMYLFGTAFFFMLGGILAMLIRVELLDPGVDVMSANTYNQVFTLHGVIMIFLFIIPAIPAALGNLMLPIMIGAKDVAFPRLNLLSWYIYVTGALIAVLSIYLGSVDTGWTFYTPYSSTTSTSVISLTFGAFVLGFSSVLTGINFIVTIHKLRAPGMTWFKMPLFAWGLYATAIIQVLATPVLAITLVLLILERLFSVGIFDPAMGGDPVLFQHFFWFYSHPAVYIMILPGMGIISELISTFSHKKIFGYKAIAFSSIGIAFLSFLVWGHHMFTSGQSEYAGMVFSFITFMVGIPSGIKVFNWMATLYRGSLTFETPMLYALSFLFLFVIGGLTGMFLGSIATDVHLHDTYFVVAHFHYVMFGGTVVAYLGGLHYWWPKIFGRMYNETWGRISAILVFLGFNFTFIPQFILGSKGMPRRYFHYQEQFQSLHVMSTVGSWLLGLGLFITLFYLMVAIFKGKPAGNNPWGALTMEWQTTSPPPTENFTEKVVVMEHGPYDYDKVPTTRTFNPPNQKKTD
jgi:cytochrome c oxidase subunit 1